MDYMYEFTKIKCLQEPFASSTLEHVKAKTSLVI